MILEKDGGRIAINPDKFDRLITALRTAVDDDGTLHNNAHEVYEKFLLDESERFFSDRVKELTQVCITRLAEVYFSASILPQLTRRSYPHSEIVPSSHICESRITHQPDQDQNTDV